MSGAQTTEQRTHVRNSRGRLFLFGIAIVAQVAWLVVLTLRLRDYSVWASLGLSLIALGIVLGMYGNSAQNASIKMPWFILMLALPILGVTLYLMVGLSGSTRAMRRRFQAIDE